MMKPSTEKPDLSANVTPVLENSHESFQQCSSKLAPNRRRRNPGMRFHVGIESQTKKPRYEGESDTEQCVCNKRVVNWNVCPMEPSAEPASPYQVAKVWFSGNLEEEVVSRSVAERGTVIALHSDLEHVRLLANDQAVRIPRGIGLDQKRSRRDTKVAEEPITAACCAAFVAKGQPSTGQQPAVYLVSNTRATGRHSCWQWKIRSRVETGSAKIGTRTCLDFTTLLLLLGATLHGTNLLAIHCARKGIKNVPKDNFNEMMFFTTKRHSNVMWWQMDE
ncbi:hypothetical protein WN48_00810 [Eufriesea mexicana]|nr:hypothetical protein WN48_00810 [Eufriesea mexicana]